MHKFGVNFKFIDEDKEWFFSFLQTEMLRFKAYLQEKRWNECNRSIKMLSSLSSFLELQPLHSRLLTLMPLIETSPESAKNIFKEAYEFVNKLPVLSKQLSANPMEP